ncbi:hypothetical protein HDU92_001360 [Lobulomyces angularis]|nr:hypothetical protein HDU92_001360 [Lobulomyces angularis]
MVNIIMDKEIQVLRNVNRTQFLEICELKASIATGEQEIKDLEDRVSNLEKYMQLQNATKAHSSKANSNGKSNPKPTSEKVSPQVAKQGALAAFESRSTDTSKSSASNNRSRETSSSKVNGKAHYTVDPSKALKCNQLHADNEDSGYFVAVKTYPGFNEIPFAIATAKAAGAATKSNSSQKIVSKVVSNFTSPKPTPKSSSQVKVESKKTPSPQKTITKQTSYHSVSTPTKSSTVSNSTKNTELSFANEASTVLSFSQNFFGYHNTPFQIPASNGSLSFSNSSAKSAKVAGSHSKCPSKPVSSFENTTSTPKTTSSAVKNSPNHSRANSALTTAKKNVSVDVTPSHSRNASALVNKVDTFQNHSSVRKILFSSNPSKFDQQNESEESIQSMYLYQNKKYDFHDVPFQLLLNKNSLLSGSEQSKSTNSTVNHSRAASNSSSTFVKVNGNISTKSNASSVCHSRISSSKPTQDVLKKKFNQHSNSELDWVVVEAPAESHKTSAFQKQTSQKNVKVGNSSTTATSKSASPVHSRTTSNNCSSPKSASPVHSRTTSHNCSSPKSVAKTEIGAIKRQENSSQKLSTSVKVNAAANCLPSKAANNTSVKTSTSNAGNKNTSKSTKKQNN